MILHQMFVEVNSGYLNFQVWLCDDASFSQQDKRHEAVGAALDQKLSVWRSVEEDSPNAHLSTPGTHLILRQAGEAQVFCCNNV